MSEKREKIYVHNIYKQNIFISSNQNHMIFKLKSLKNTQKLG